MTKAPITRPATAEKIDGSTPAKSSTQQLLEEITKLRQVNEVLLTYEHKKKADRHWRYMVMVGGFTLAMLLSVLSSFAGGSNTNQFVGITAVLFVMLITFLPFEWRW